MTRAWLLVVKGNLRHRIELIGMEKPKEELTDAQRKLREAAEAVPCRGLAPENPERPGWANGACIYLVDQDVDEIAEAIKEWAEKDPTHIHVQAHVGERRVEGCLEGVMSAKPEGSGREAFEIRRAGDISTEDES